MGMQSFDALLPDIEVRAQGCPEPTIIANIRDALTQLCQECRAWSVIDTIILDPPGPSGDEIIITPAGTVLVDVQLATYEGQPLTAISLTDLIDRRTRWQWQSMDDAGYPRSPAGGPAYITQSCPNTVRIEPRQGGEIVRLHYFVKPTGECMGAPDHILRKYRLELIEGALARILMIPNQPFSNPQLALYHQQRWDSALMRHSTDWFKGQQAAPIRSRAQFF